MAEISNEAGDFEFDPDQLEELSALAEAFIHEELDAELMANLDREYLETLVDCSGTKPPSEIPRKEYEAAIEIAELILNRMDAIDK